MSSTGTLPKHVTATVEEVRTRYIEEGKLTKSEMDSYRDLLGRSIRVASFSSVIGGVGGYLLIKKRLPTWGVPARIFGSIGCSTVASFMGSIVGAASAAAEMSRLAPGKGQVFADMNAEITQRLSAIGQDFVRQSQGLPPIQGNGQAKFDNGFGTDRNLSTEEGEREIERRSSGYFPPAEERRSTEPSPIISETKSSWDKVRSKAENSMGTQQTQTRFPERRRGTEQQVDTRSQEQKDFDALLEKERQGIDD